MPNFDTVNDFVAYLTETLIPDLQDSGFEATADDFSEAVYWLNSLQDDLESTHDTMRRIVDAIGQVTFHN